MNSNRALKSLRGKKMKTQQEIADKLGISRQMYNSYENETSKCDLETIYKILLSLEADEREVDEFLCGLKQDYLSYETEIQK